MKRFFGILLAAMLLTASCAFADSAVDVILATGTTQAFTDEAVAPEDLETILRAGLSTESAINQQPWFFVAITDPEVMKELGGSGSAMPAGAPADMGDGASSGAPADVGDGASSGAPAGDMPAGAPGDMGDGESSGAPSGGMPAAPAGGTGAKASLGDSPAAIIIYMNKASSSPNASFDCGLAAQNMVIAASSLGYGVKIVSSPTMTLNGANHDALCEKLGVDPSMEAVAVLLIGKPDETVDAAAGATTRDSFESKVSIIE